MRDLIGAWSGGVVFEEGEGEKDSDATYLFIGVGLVGSFQLFVVELWRALDKQRPETNPT